MHHSEPIEVLDKLLVLAADGVEGYRHAADAVKSPGIRRTLQKSAADREEIVSVLTNTLVSLGYKPSHHGSIPGAVHRRWLDALRPLTHGSAEAILKECQRGEQATIAGFSHALGRGLPEDIHAVVQAQLGRVLMSSARLRRLVVELEDEPRHV
jgi:uncharacterized protein (TIGR02284 family)